MICAKAVIDQTKLPIGSGAARVFYHKMANRLVLYVVANLWTNMVVTREEGKENRRYYKEDTAFRCLQGELSVYAENFSDSFF